MPETAVAPAPAAASTPAPAAAAPSAAPVSTPAAAPVAAPSAQPTAATSALDPSQFKSRNAYAEAVLTQELAGIPPEVPVEEVSPVVAEPEVAPVVEVPTETAEETPEPEKPVAEDEPEFDFNPPAALTPEALTKMVTDNPEFGKLLESDPKLKGQIYKTAREAAELAPYKAFFPDAESAKEAAQELQSWNGIRDTFMQAATKEGAQATLAKMMELSYERDDDGNVVMQNGKAVVGQDFYGFVDNVVAMDLEHRRADVQARLEANQYHVGAKTEQERDDAIARDQARVAFFDEQLKEVIEADGATMELPEPLRQKAAEIERRERELNERTHGTKVEHRATFERSVVTETQDRLKSSIKSTIASAKKQGAVISPYLEKVLPESIYAAVIQKIVADEGLKNRQVQLQRLPATDKSKTRRMAESDRAIQTYLPDIAREQLAAAGIQLLNGAKAKAEKVDAQANITKQTEIPGARGVSRGAAPLAVDAAFDQAKSEWVKANPGRTFDKGDRGFIGRLLQLQLQ